MRFRDRLLLSHGRKSWLRWLPFLILLVAAIVLALEWDRLPERWPIHWGFRGQADNWASKTPFWVFFPIGFGVLMCFIIEMLALHIVSHPQSGKNNRVRPEAARMISDMTADFVRLIGIMVAIVFGSLAVAMPLLRPQRLPLWMVFIFAVVLGAIGIGMRRLVQGARELKARGMFEGLEGWNGLIYRNPNDPRLWVPKITGFGYTLNFGHRWAWPFMILMISIPLLMLIIAMVLSR